MKDTGKKFLFKLQFKIYATNVAVGLITLIAGELLPSMFNNRLDLAGATFFERVAFAFKPMVLSVFAFAAILVNILTYFILKPLFRYFSKGTDYEKARVATVRLPWVLIRWFYGLSVLRFTI